MLLSCARRSTHPSPPIRDNRRIELAKRATDRAELASCKNETKKFDSTSDSNVTSHFDDIACSSQIDQNNESNDDFYDKIIKDLNKITGNNVVTSDFSFLDVNTGCVNSTAVTENSKLLTDSELRTILESSDNDGEKQVLMSQSVLLKQYQDQFVSPRSKFTDVRELLQILGSDSENETEEYLFNSQSDDAFCETADTPEKNSNNFHNSIVNMQHFIDIFQKVSAQHVMNNNCKPYCMQLNNSFHNGFKTKYEFKCTACSYTTQIWSMPENSDIIDINLGTVAGVICIGIGFAQLLLENLPNSL